MSDEIKSLEAEIKQMSIELDKKKEKLLQLKKQNESSPLKLDNDAIARYSRQIILPEIGPKGQEKIMKAKVLIVGAGGLGCPCCLYLCAAGIGTIGLVDYDTVDISNIHRQVMHTEHRVGLSKSLSCTLSGSDINSNTKFEIHNVSLTSKNALELLERYDIVIDCSDNVATRYLLNDACVIAGKPLVSGSALRLEAQLTVYNYSGGPCYRCIYPKPPPPETITNCSDGGVLGPITGALGSLQALETLKIIVGLPGTLHKRMLMYDGQSSVFRDIKLRPKQDSCQICGKNPQITELIDYVQFCGAGPNDKAANLSILSPEERITVKEYRDMLQKGTDHYLIDVRQPIETEICKLPYEKQLNIPVDEFTLFNLENVQVKFESFVVEDLPVFIVCHRGNDSQRIVQFLKSRTDKYDAKDVKGGMEAWSREIDENCPRY